MQAGRPEEESDRRVSLTAMQARGPVEDPGDRLGIFWESR